MARREEIERLYHEALARPAGERDRFLRDACGEDDQLRREVESLLAQERSAETFLPAPAREVAAGAIGEDFSASLIGQQLGGYQVVSRLGVGGMGEVYRARDTRLGRDVAIKVLPKAFAADPDRISRFEREARLLAALNHPHIAAIYGFEESGGQRALVLELVEGPTLADRLEAGPLPLTEALTIAQQIADALVAAHAKGIIHRDLKPANIKVAPGGIVKILDFGLAKMWAPDPAGLDLSQAPTITSTGTHEGVLLGTAPYMSPEQARGKALDTRTDSWAFGCVLFEMLTAQPAFKGETLSDTIGRILEREPDWQQLPRSIPARVRDLLRRCLQKDPGKRLSDLAEARQDIDACLASPFKIPLAILESFRWSLSRPVVRWSLAALAVVLAGLTIYGLRDREEPLPTLTNPIQVTSAVGVEDHPTWSPDRRTIAYESSESGNWDIWVTQVGGGPSVNRTVDHGGVDRYASWSPDGRQIAFWSDREGGGYYVMPALGGPAVRLISTPGVTEFFQSAPEWSADGTQLAGVTYTVDESRFQQILEIVSLVTREARQVDLPGIEQARLDLSWSRDGRYMAYVDAGQQQSEVTKLWVLRLSDGEATELTDGRANVRRPRWSPDGRYLFYVANRAGPPDLWRQRVSEDGAPVGEPERVTTGLEIRDAAFSPDGTKLVYSKGRWVSNVWRVPILEQRPATWADAMQITFDQAFVEFVNLSPDGKSLLYSSDRTGNQDLWIAPIGGEARQLTVDPAPDWSPHMSPDGQQLAFYSYRTGDREIWTMPASGGPATQLTHSKGLDATPKWSPDGREIAFRSERTGDSEIWVMASDGSRQRQMTKQPSNEGAPSWSPDGQWLTFVSSRTGTVQVWRISSKGGDPELLTRGPGAVPEWSPDGDHIYFYGFNERIGNIWAFSLKDRSERPVTNLVGKRGTLGMQPPATDGKFLYFQWRDDLGDIWVMDVGP